MVAGHSQNIKKKVKEASRHFSVDLNVRFRSARMQPLWRVFSSVVVEEGQLGRKGAPLV